MHDNRIEQYWHSQILSITEYYKLLIQYLTKHLSFFSHYFRLCKRTSLISHGAKREAAINQNGAKRSQGGD